MLPLLMHLKGHTEICYLLIVSINIITLHSIFSVEWLNYLSSELFLLLQFTDHFTSVVM